MSTLTQAETAALRAVLRSAKKGFAAPPWLAFPCVPAASMCWRMGSGETHMMEWGEWLTETLSSKDRDLYQRAFPAPRSWCGPRGDYYDTTCGDGEDGGSSGGSAPALTPQQAIAEEVGVALWTPDGKPAVCSREALQSEGRDKNASREFLYFWGHTPPKNGKVSPAIFSQWWTTVDKADGRPKVQFSEDRNDFVCSEQYMMAAKAMVFGDDATYERILKEASPKRIKTLGRQVRDFDATVWEAVAFSLVAQGNYCKFVSNPLMRDYLLRTGDAVIVEASPYDAVWGIGRSTAEAAKHGADLTDAAQWRGDNLLGFALMEVRAEIRRVHANEHLLEEELE